MAREHRCITSCEFPSTVWECREKLGSSPSISISPVPRVQFTKQETARCLERVPGSYSLWVVISSLSLFWKVQIIVKASGFTQFYYKFSCYLKKKQHFFVQGKECQCSHPLFHSTPPLHYHRSRMKLHSIDVLRGFIFWQGEVKHCLIMYHRWGFSCGHTTQR